MKNKLARVKPEQTVDLTAADIADQCQRWVPVNTLISEAIKAHRLLFRVGKLSEAEARTASFALRAVALARMPDVKDCRQMLDYLTGLPIEAWEVETIQGYTAEQWRQDTLRMIARCLTWMMER